MAITPNYDLDVDTSLGGADASDYVIPSQKAIKAYVDNNSGTPSNMVTTDTAQNITGTKTFVGQKKIAFKQSSSSDKLGFTLYNNSGTEKGYLEYNPSNTVDSVPLMTLGNYATAAAGLTHVGFRKYSSISGASGAYNLLAPLISDAKTPFNLTTTYTNFYLPLGFTDGNTTVLTAKTGVVDLSSLLPTVGNGTITINQGGTTKGTFTLNQSGNTTIDLDAGGGGTVDQTFDGTSANAQSGVAIETILTDGSYSPVFDYLYLGADSYGYIYNETDTEFDENATTIIANGSALRVVDNVGAFYNQYQLLTTDNTFTDGSNFVINDGLTYTTSNNNTILSSSDGDTSITAFNNNNNTSLIIQPDHIGLNTNNNGVSLTVDSNNKLNANGGVVATLNDIPDVSTLADYNLSNLTTTGKAVIDGQWVSSYQGIISSNTSLNSSTPLLKRIELPNDGHDYEVLLRGSVITGSTAGNFVYLTCNGTNSIISSSTYITGCTTRAAGAVYSVGSGIITAKYVASTGTNLSITRNTGYNGSCRELTVIAYRRIGTNA